MDVAKIMSILNKNSDANRDLLTAIDTVAATISALAAFTGGIERIGVDIELLALIVEECVELTREDARKSHGRNLASIRGGIVPYIRLGHEFRIKGEAPRRSRSSLQG